MTEQHTKEMFYANADECDHMEPEDDMSDEWQDWQERHPSYEDGWLCLDKPVGEHCVECSEEYGETAWERCRMREHARMKGIGRRGQVTPEAGHTEVEVFVGLYDCLDGDCDEMDVDEPPEVCSHINHETACSCQLDNYGEVVRPCTKEGLAFLGGTVLGDIPPYDQHVQSSGQG